MERYKRHINIDFWGEEGQKKLASKKVFIAGAGGLGSVVSLILAGAGIGEIIIADYDKVELTNLNRQFLYSECDVGILKSEAAKSALTRINSDVKINTFGEKIDFSFLNSVCGEVDIIFDCLDGKFDKLMLNEFAVINHMPLLYAGVDGNGGAFSFINPGETHCLNCIFSLSSGDMSDNGIAGAFSSIVASYQAYDGIRFLLGLLPVSYGKIMFWEWKSGYFSSVSADKDDNCPVCGSRG